MMDQDEQQNKTTFSTKAAYLGFISYLILIFIIAIIFLHG